MNEDGNRDFAVGFTKMVIKKGREDIAPEQVIRMMKAESMLSNPNFELGENLRALESNFSKTLSLTVD